MTDPIIGPMKNLAPPISAMNTAMPDSCQPSSPGAMLRWNGPHSAPAMPANAPADHEIHQHVRAHIDAEERRCDADCRGSSAACSRTATDDAPHDPERGSHHQQREVVVVDGVLEEAGRQQALHAIVAACEAVPGEDDVIEQLAECQRQDGEVDPREPHAEIARRPARPLPRPAAPRAARQKTPDTPCRRCRHP